MEVAIEGESLSCKVPVWRQDIEMEADIAEEVLRMYGYDSLPSTLMTGVTMPGGLSEKKKAANPVRNALVSRGFYETYSFSFVSPRWLRELPVPEDDPRRSPIVIRNPLGEDTSVMRTSLLPSMLSVCAFNQSRGAQEFRLFELSSTFFPKKDDILADEKSTLCMAMYGPDVDFYALRDAAYAVIEQFGAKPSIAPGGDAYFHPGRKAEISVRGGIKVAQLGEIHPDYAEKFDLSGRLYVAEIDIEALTGMRSTAVRLKPLPKFPAVTRDLALVMDESVNVGPVADSIRKHAGRELERVDVFDIYRGTQLGPDRKSVAFSLSFRAADRTMTDTEINACMDKVLAACRKEFGAELR